jgi:hypothetical protein
MVMIGGMVMRAMWLLPATLLMSGSCSAAEKAKIPLRGVKSAGVPVTYARPAVDHVVTYAYWRGFGPRGGDRITVRRHGSLVRQTTEYIGSKRDADPKTETNYTNLATGAAASLTERGPGAPMGITFWRETEKTRGQYRYEFVRTAEVRTIAGERCQMWRADPLGEKGHAFTGVPRRACITNDGVVLYDAWGQVSEERTAIKIERRKVALADVLPPREALDWNAWLGRVGQLQRKPTGRPVNYDLLLTRRTSMDTAGDPDRVRYRASEGWELRESWAGAKRVGFTLFDTSFAVRLTQSD